MQSYMERVAHPPEYDEPEATQSEVLDVVFGKRSRDGLGRTDEDLLCDSPLVYWAERVTLDTDAELELMQHIGRHLERLPRIKAIFEELAESAAKQDESWRHA